MNNTERGMTSVNFDDSDTGVNSSNGQFGKVVSAFMSKFRLPSSSVSKPKQCLDIEIYNPRFAFSQQLLYGNFSYDVVYNEDLEFDMERNTDGIYHALHGAFSRLLSLFSEENKTDRSLVFKTFKVLKRLVKYVPAYRQIAILNHILTGIAVRYNDTADFLNLLIELDKRYNQSRLYDCFEVFRAQLTSTERRMYTKSLQDFDIYGGKSRVAFRKQRRQQFKRHKSKMKCVFIAIRSHYHVS